MCILDTTRRLDLCSPEVYRQIERIAYKMLCQCVPDWGGLWALDGGEYFPLHELLTERVHAAVKAWNDTPAINRDGYTLRAWIVAEYSGPLIRPADCKRLGV